MNVRATNLIKASLAARRSVHRRHEFIGFCVAGDLANGRQPIITNGLVEDALAALADQLEADHLSQEADELRALERAA